MFKSSRIFIFGLLIAAGLVNCRPRQGTKSDTKLIGGDGASAEQFPFVLALFMGNKLVCSATKVGPEKILTAAHCTWDSEKRSFSIAAGSDLQVTNQKDISGDKQSLISVKVKEVYFPPNLDIDDVEDTQRFSIASDLAIIDVDRKSPEFSAFADLPIATIDFSPLKAGDAVIKTGYGCDYEYPVPNVVIIKPAKLRYKNEIVAEWAKVEAFIKAWIEDLRSNFEKKYTETLPNIAEDKKAKFKQSYKDELSRLPISESRLFASAKLRNFTPGRALDKDAASICNGDSGGPLLDAKSPSHIRGVNSSGYVDLKDARNRSALSSYDSHVRLDGEMEKWLKFHL